MLAVLVVVCTPLRYNTCAAISVPMYSAEQLPGFLLNASVSVILLMNDVSVSESHFHGLRTPLILSRDVVLDGGAAKEAMPCLDMNFTSNMVGKILVAWPSSGLVLQHPHSQLHVSPSASNVAVTSSTQQQQQHFATLQVVLAGTGTTLTFARMALVRGRSVAARLAPGLDLLASSTPGLAPAPRLLMDGVACIFRELHAERGLGAACQSLLHAVVVVQMHGVLHGLGAHMQSSCGPWVPADVACCMLHASRRWMVLVAGTCTLQPVTAASLGSTCIARL